MLWPESIRISLSIMPTVESAARVKIFFVDGGWKEWVGVIGRRYWRIYGSGNKRLREVREIAGKGVGICEQVDYVFGPLGWKSRATFGSGQVRMRYEQPFRIEVVWGYRCCSDDRLWRCRELELVLLYTVFLLGRAQVIWIDNWNWQWHGSIITPKPGFWRFRNEEQRSRIGWDEKLRLFVIENSGFWFADVGVTKWACLPCRQENSTSLLAADRR